MLHELDGIASSSTSGASKHLDTAPLGYLLAINQPTKIEVDSYVEKMKPVTKVVGSASSILSVGVGAGLEIEALHRLYHDSGIKFTGIDISQKALFLAQSHLDRIGVEAQLLFGDICNLGEVVGDETFDIVTMSSVLHEIYSYIPNGYRAFESAIANALMHVSQGGALFIRDFAAPDEPDRKVGIIPSSQYSMDFYDYFRSRYRTFETWDMIDQLPGARSIATNSVAYPKPDEQGRAVLTHGDAAEMMLHCRNHADHVQRGFLVPFDRTWKEIDECYLVPTCTTFSPLSPGDYTRVITDIARQVSTTTKMQYTVDSTISPRPHTAKQLREYFILDDDVYDQIPRKLEIIIRAEASEHGQIFRY